VHTAIAIGTAILVLVIIIVILRNKTVKQSSSTKGQNNKNTQPTTFKLDPAKASLTKQRVAELRGLGSTDSDIEQQLLSEDWPRAYINNALDKRKRI
jgi:hypothetical protein